MFGYNFSPDCGACRFIFISSVLEHIFGLNTDIALPLPGLYTGIICPTQTLEHKIKVKDLP
jgi:hypothetical protein